MQLPPLLHARQGVSGKVEDVHVHVQQPKAIRSAQMWGCLICGPMMSSADAAVASVMDMLKCHLGQ